MQQETSRTDSAIPIEMPRADTDSMKFLNCPSDCLPLWVADMDFRASEPIIAAMRKRVEHGVFGYSLPTEELVSTCVAYCARRWNWQVDPDWLVFTPGLGVAIHTVTRYLGDSDKPVLVPKPIYYIFRSATERAKRLRIDISFLRAGNDWELDFQSLAANAANYGRDCVLMLCNPHNPNGKIFSRNELEELAELALRNGWLICSDEVHADLILDEDREHIPIASLSPEVSKITLTMQSPSKAFNIAGMNFALMIIEDPQLRKQYRYGASGQVISELNPLGMTAGIAAWNGSSDAWLSSCLTKLRCNRDLLATAIERLAGISMPHLASTYLAWLDISALKLNDPEEHFLKHGLKLSPGKVFGDTDFMRLNFGCATTTVTEAIKRLEHATK